MKRIAWGTLIVLGIIAVWIIAAKLAVAEEETPTPTAVATPTPTPQPPMCGTQSDEFDDCLERVSKAEQLNRRVGFLEQSVERMRQDVIAAFKSLEPRLLPVATPKGKK